MEQKKQSIPLKRRRDQLSKNIELWNIRHLKVSKDNEDKIKRMSFARRKYKSSAEVNKVKISTN